MGMVMMSETQNRRLKSATSGPAWREYDDSFSGSCHGWPTWASCNVWLGSSMCASLCSSCAPCISSFSFYQLQRVHFARSILPAAPL